MKPEPTVSPDFEHHISGCDGTRLMIIVADESRYVPVDTVTYQINLVDTAANG